MTPALTASAILRSMRKIAAAIGCKTNLSVTPLAVSAPRSRSPAHARALVRTRNAHTRTTRALRLALRCHEVCRFRMPETALVLWL